jgi:hypothetical protein
VEVHDLTVNKLVMGDSAPRRCSLSTQARPGVRGPVARGGSRRLAFAEVPKATTPF